MKPRRATLISMAEGAIMVAPDKTDQEIAKALGWGCRSAIVAKARQRAAKRASLVAKDQRLLEQQKLENVAEYERKVHERKEQRRVQDEEWQAGG